MRSVAVAASVLSGLALAPPARAQQAAPAATALSGEPTSLSGQRASTPLRLSLEATVPPIGAQFPQCQGLGDEAGNSVGGIPVEHYAEVTIVPHLVLSGFSQMGCPIDAGAGGSLTWSMPVRSGWFVLGAGGYVNPGRFPMFPGVASAIDPRLLNRPVNVAARADYFWQAANGRVFNLGVQTSGVTRQLVTFGSSF